MVRAIALIVLCSWSSAAVYGQYGAAQPQTFAPSGQTPDYRTPQMRSASPAAEETVPGLPAPPRAASQGPGVAVRPEDIPPSLPPSTYSPGVPYSPGQGGTAASPATAMPPSLPQTLPAPPQASIVAPPVETVPPVVIPPPVAAAVEPLVLPGFERNRLVIRELMSRGNTLAHQGYWAEAVAKYNQVVLIEPRHAQAYLQRGLSLARLGACDQARQDFAEVSRLEPQSLAQYAGQIQMVARCAYPETPPVSGNGGPVMSPQYSQPFQAQRQLPLTPR